MATGRTVNRHQRIYVDGYDLSGYVAAVGPYGIEYEVAKSPVCFTDGVQSSLPGQPMVTLGDLKGVLDPTATSGLHAIMKAGTGARKVMVAIGTRAAPAAGDPVFCGAFQQGEYKAMDDGGFQAVTIKMEPWDTTNLMAYSKPWGNLVSAYRTVLTGDTPSTAAGIDDNGGSSLTGGWMMYQIFGGDGKATITIEEASTNTNVNFALLDGATTGFINCVVPSAGIVAIATNKAVKQYLRWQIDFTGVGGGTTATFALAFIRA